MPGDIQPVLLEVVGHQRRFPVLDLKERRRLLGARAEVGKAPVVPHPLDQERPLARLILQSVGELEARGILRPERLGFTRRKRGHVGDPGIGVNLGGLGRLHRGLRHLPIGRDLAPCDKGGLMGGRRDARIIRRLRLDANHQVGLGLAFRDEKRVDPPGRAHQRHVGGDPLGDRFEESQIGGSGQVPVLAVSHDEIQDGFRRGKHDDGGVPGLGANRNDLVLGFDNPQHRPAVLSDQRQRDQ